RATIAPPPRAARTARAAQWRRAACWPLPRRSSARAPRTAAASSRACARPAARAAPTRARLASYTLPLMTEAVEHLRALIRFDTSNPPGHERPAAEYVAAVGRRAGLEARVRDSGPGRGNALLRLPGRGEAPPILVLAH